MSLDPATLLAINELHYCNSKGLCSRCHHSYPCDARRLLETVYTLRAQRDEEAFGECEGNFLAAYDAAYNAGYDAGYDAGYHEGRADASGSD